MQQAQAGQPGGQAQQHAVPPQLQAGQGLLKAGMLKFEVSWLLIASRTTWTKRVQVRGGCRLVRRHDHRLCFRQEQQRLQEAQLLWTRSHRRHSTCLQVGPGPGDGCQAGGVVVGRLAVDGQLLQLQGTQRGSGCGSTRRLAHGGLAGAASWSVQAAHVTGKADPAQHKGKGGGWAGGGQGG